MNKKITISRKTLKIILGACIGATVLMTVGFFLYIYMVDKNTLGRSIRICQTEVSKLTVEEAEQKIVDTFGNREVSFQEDGGEVRRITLRELGYSLDQETLKTQLAAIKEERDSDRQIFARPVNYSIGYQVNRK